MLDVALITALYGGHAAVARLQGDRVIPADGTDDTVQTVDNRQDTVFERGLEYMALAEVRFDVRYERLTSRSLLVWPPCTVSTTAWGGRSQSRNTLPAPYNVNQRIRSLSVTRGGQGAQRGRQEGRT